MTTNDIIFIQPLGNRFQNIMVPIITNVPSSICATNIASIILDAITWNREQFKIKKKRL